MTLIELMLAMDILSVMFLYFMNPYMILMYSNPPDIDRHRHHQQHPASDRDGFGVHDQEWLDQLRRGAVALPFC